MTNCRARTGVATVSGVAQPARLVLAPDWREEVARADAHRARAATDEFFVLMDEAVGLLSEAQLETQRALGLGASDTIDTAAITSWYGLGDLA